MTVNFLLALIRLYQWTLSPFLGGACRFTPSCSAYAAEAVQRHGALHGSWLALKRLSRCHPLGGYGVDPVPSRVRPAGEKAERNVRFQRDLRI